MSEPSSPESDAVLSRRAQILATEHWGLLAARSTTQSEVLTRITIFLALVSAGLRSASSGRPRASPDGSAEHPSPSSPSSPSSAS